MIKYIKKLFRKRHDCHICGREIEEYTDMERWPLKVRYNDTIEDICIECAYYLERLNRDE